MDTPIFDIVLRTPLPSPLIRFRAAWCGEMSPSTPRALRSSTVAIARYGFTALAPYPTSRAMWCTSRASPDSTMSPTWVRVFSRTRWWCTAPVSSSDGIGAFVAVTPRSDSTITRAPSSMASDTSERIWSSLATSAAPPPRTS